MKVILSRKGFDSCYGGRPSPILDGRIISLPIPSTEKADIIRFSDLKLDPEIDPNKTYFELMKELGITEVSLGERKKDKSRSKHKEELNETTRCHLDPDLCKKIIKRSEDWRPLFGQAEIAQRHLMKKGNEVKENDLFLFFGTFREAERKNEHWVFKEGTKEKHVFFGYLQIEKILPNPHNPNGVESWMKKILG